MSGGVKAGWFSALAVSGLMLGGVSAQAADLGGDCCSDLEERIADLEATTARKGNRKVSLAISGWVNEAVFFWDDGTERNVYIGTNTLEQSRFKFAGEAKIDKDWSAGYTLEVGVAGAASSTFSQSSTGTSTSLTLRKSNWYLKSKTYGKLTVGLDGTSTYHLLDDADGANTRNYSDAEAARVALGAFGLRSGGSAAAAGNLTWGNIMAGYNNGTPGQDGRRNIVKYDSPEFGGFVASVSWGEDDLWDTSLSYKGELHDFKIVGRIGYGESTDQAATNCTGPASGFKCTWWGAAGTVMHAPTGLYLYAGYGEQKIESLPGSLDDTSTTWFIQPGIERKWHPIGKTTIFGEYRKDDAGALFSGTSNTATLNSQGADLTHYAGGIVQSIDAAAMDLYVIYRHSEGDFINKAGTKVGLDDFDMVISGARIQF